MGTLGGVKGKSRMPKTPIKRKKQLERSLRYDPISPHSPRGYTTLRRRNPREASPTPQPRPKKGIWDTPTKQRMITLHSDAGGALGPTAIAAEIGQGATRHSVGMVLRRHQGQQVASRRKTTSRGRKRTLSKADIVRMIDFLSRNWFTRRFSWQELRIKTNSPPASDKLIEQKLKEQGYTRCKACRKPYISENSRKTRLEFVDEHKHWKSPSEDPNSPLRDVYFSDEVRYYTGVGGAVYVIRAQGERDCPDCTQTTYHSGRKAFSMFSFWGYDFKAPLLKLKSNISPLDEPMGVDEFIQEAEQLFDKAFKSVKAAREALEGTVKKKTRGKDMEEALSILEGKQGRKQQGFTQKEYAEGVLKRFIAPFFAKLEQELGRKPILYEDGNSAHGLKSDNNPAAAMKKKLNLQTMKAPPQSPDFNLIEKGWRFTKSKTKAQSRSEEARPHDLEKLEALVRAEWDKVSLEYIRGQYDRWPKTLKECKARKGWMTPW